MENTKQKMLLYLIVILLIVNLLGTLWLVKQVAFQPKKLTSKIEDQEALPDYMTNEVKKEIYKKVEEAYNSEDYEHFWNLFSDLARVQMSKDNIKEVYFKLRSMFGDVRNGVFNYYEFAGKRGNLKHFIFYYKVQYEQKDFGGKGNTIITITDDGQEYGIFTIQLSFD